MSDVLTGDKDAAFRIAEAAKVLAEYGLAVSSPHIHTAGGGWAPLPPGIVAYEEDLTMSFRPACDVPAQATPVSWRWVEGRLEVCGLCCANHLPPPPPPPPPPRPGV